MHNKPLNVKEIDSPLTPLGMYQATELGKIIKNDLDGKNIFPILCCSFLQRSQLTGLILLNQLGMLNENNAVEKWSMQKLHDTMIAKAYNRWSKRGLDLKIFEKYIVEADGYNFKNFVDDFNSDIRDKYINNNPHRLSVVQTNFNVGGKSKKKQPKRLRRKSRKHFKNKK